MGYTLEEIKRATTHSTNKAFDRYLEIGSEENLPVYQDARGGKKLERILTLPLNLTYCNRYIKVVPMAGFEPALYRIAKGFGEGAF
jgi:hypothetical protein